MPVSPRARTSRRVRVGCARLCVFVFARELRVSFPPCPCVHILLCVFVRTCSFQEVFTCARVIRRMPGAPGVVEGDRPFTALRRNTCPRDSLGSFRAWMQRTPVPRREGRDSLTRLCGIGRQLELASVIEQLVYGIRFLVETG